MNTRYAPPGGTSIERTGAPIWENLYDVRVPYVDTLSAQFLKDVGMPSVRNKILDRQMHNDTVNVCITINAIVEYFRRGVTIHFRNNDDTTEIYSIVNNYLLAWKEQIDCSLNIGSIPTEDLLLLDRFAETLYPVAKRFGVAPRATSSLFANLFGGDGQFVSRGSLFAGTPLSPEKPEQEKHISLGNDLAKAIATLKSQWN